jgi:hypothetical protein
MLPCNYVAEISDRRAGYLDWLIKKTTEIHLNKNNLTAKVTICQARHGLLYPSLLMNEKQDKAEHILDTPH